MPTTTAAEICDAIAARIRVLTPTLELGTPFVEHAYQEDIYAWAPRHKASCMRRYSVRASGSVMPPVVSTATIERVEQMFEVVIAYPATLRQGNLRERDKLIELDLALLEHNVGTNGFATYATSAPDATITSPEPTRREEDTDGVVFGVLPLHASYWRAQP
jgi:hypothetical protein